jgi:hypothetical protein
VDAVESVLAMLGSIAGILGLVVAYNQYRLTHKPFSPPPSGASPAPQVRWPAGPPMVVRVLIVWLVVLALLIACVGFVVFTVVMQNLEAMIPNSSPVSEEAEIIVPAVVAGVIGVVMLPLAIIWGAHLRDREPTIRAKLLGVVAADLFTGVVIVIIVLAADLSVPHPVRVAAAVYIVFAILADSLSLSLLLHPDTRDWVATGPHARAG